MRFCPICCTAAILVGFASIPVPASADQEIVAHDRAPDFQLTDQNGKTVTRDSLRGKVWVASFFFSTCTECNKTTVQQLRRLQNVLAGWPDVRLVSFTVDPVRDSPKQLEVFAEQLQIDSNRWLLLTETDPKKKDTLHELIRTGFAQTAAIDPEPFLFTAITIGLCAAPSSPGALLATTTLMSPDPPLKREPKTGAEFIHTFRFILIDHHSNIRGYFDGQDTAQVDELSRQIKERVQAKYLPSINAALNALAGLLLLSGWLAIRRRWITLHKICMLAALTVSALFLASYLYYHLAIQHGQPTRFTGQGWIRSLYFAILLTHTILAVVVAPLALTTAYLGVRNQLLGHVRIARWTLPMWLYVSITGVVVYWMLYQLYPPG